MEVQTQTQTQMRMEQKKIYEAIRHQAEKAIISEESPVGLKVSKMIIIKKPDDAYVDEIKNDLISGGYIIYERKLEHNDCIRIAKEDWVIRWV